MNIPGEPTRLHLAHLPTPLVPLERLAGELGVPRVLMKHDDFTGLAVSGNKIRKLEYLLADAVAGGHDTVVTFGGHQSNHCRATASACARLGLHCHLILRGPATGEPGLDGNFFLDHLLGATCEVLAPDRYRAERDAAADRYHDKTQEQGRKAYEIPVGGSNALGCWGYVRMMTELGKQLAGASADLFLAVGSNGTLAGCVLGRQLLGLDNVRVVGVSVSDSADVIEHDTRALITAFGETFGHAPADLQGDFDVLDRFVGDGYAISTDAGLHAIRRLALGEGVLLDPTYTGKAMAGMLATIAGGGVRDGAVPVFLHTGGAFGLMASRELFA